MNTSDSRTLVAELRVHKCLRNVKACEQAHKNNPAPETAAALETAIDELLACYSKVKINNRELFASVVRVQVKHRGLIIEQYKPFRGAP